MRKTIATIIGAVVGCVLAFVLCIALTDTGHPPLGGADLMERGREFTPYFFGLLGAVAGAVIGNVCVRRQPR